MLIGARMVVPIMPGIMVFASVFGAAASAKGLTLLEAVMMSGLVYAGVSQLVSLELWRVDWTVPAMATVAAITATINARMILMSASLQPWLAGAPYSWSATSLFFLTDPNWLMSLRYRTEGGRDLGVLLGSGIVMWLTWVSMTIPGHLAGSLLEDPRRFGIDLVMPIYFAVMLVPIWKGPRAGLPWLVSGIVGLGFSHFIGGYLHILIAALAGAITGAFMPEAPKREARDA